MNNKEIQNNCKLIKSLKDKKRELLNKLDDINNDPRITTLNNSIINNKKSIIKQINEIDYKLVKLNNDFITYSDSNINDNNLDDKSSPEKILKLILNNKTNNTTKTNLLSQFKNDIKLPLNENKKPDEFINNKGWMFSENDKEIQIKLFNDINKLYGLYLDGELHITPHQETTIKKLENLLEKFYV